MRVLKPGAVGQDVRQIQIVLNSLLKPIQPLEVDGKYGPNTEAAVRAFQRNRGLEVDGEVGPRTRSALALQPAEVSRPKPPATGRSWLDIAAAEEGVREDAKVGEHNRRIIEYHATTTLRAATDEVAWCSSFVNWVVKQAGQRGTNSARAASWLDWGRKLDQPQSGCIVVIKKKTKGFTQATGSTSGYHVGFLVSATPTHLNILGGNQGNRVKKSNFALASYDVKGYRV